ncbi:MAG TPA: DNA-3-methyladenine glycosylase [Patescibacteria group bacterium]|nr:DNA-3-methyladenine glycosylase [Patescibacteria group bacterium]
MTKQNSFSSILLKDPVMAKLIKKYPEASFSNKAEKLFEDLIDSIVSQQLSIKAANTIFTRFKALFPDSFPTPQDILSTPDETIRTAGISFQKISYIKSVADAFLSDLIDTKKIQDMSDNEVIESLTQIKGVGKWTAEMILIFTLGREDVFSIGDLGIRNAITRLYGITDKKDMEKLSENWHPYRSYACWYLWRSLENG